MATWRSAFISKIANDNATISRKLLAERSNKSGHVGNVRPASVSLWYRERQQSTPYLFPTVGFVQV
jgi:hypothetical protein